MYLGGLGLEIFFFSSQTPPVAFPSLNKPNKSTLTDNWLYKKKKPTTHTSPPQSQ